MLARSQNLLWHFLCHFRLVDVRWLIQPPSELRRPFLPWSQQEISELVLMPNIRDDTSSSNNGFNIGQIELSLFDGAIFIKLFHLLDVGYEQFRGVLLPTFTIDIGTKSATLNDGINTLSQASEHQQSGSKTHPVPWKDQQSTRFHRATYHNRCPS